MRAALLLGLVMWAGATLVLAEVRWFTRPTLVDRLRPYVVGPLSGRVPPPSPLSVESFRDLALPVAQAVGSRLALAFGVHEDAAARLARIHSPLDVSEFRMRQLGYAVVATPCATAVAVAMDLGPAPAAAFVAAAPLLSFLVPEQQLLGASERRQRRLLLELPVVSEQLAMLTGAGYSLGATVQRVAARGTGVCARDLQRVSGRVRQGVPVDIALREWAAAARVPELDRLVSVLALDRETGDLGRLLSNEARAIRQEVQRQAVATMTRRAQQVWVPVTVATLVPGVIFLCVPFVEALRLFSGS